MIFVDTNVFMYAVGRPHPLRESPAPSSPSTSRGERCCARTGVIWPVEPEDVELARSLVSSEPGLRARDLLHLACCRRRGVERVMTYDRGLAAAFPSG